ncbi:Pentatricopeptide repeat-containing protein At2g31400 [Durusdinium trenchii]|uniref:Chloroplastic n=1 Tax=Durusdinium trenchii TaxID=1381693 RepID=A0ABP0QK24_9DINO
MSRALDWQTPAAAQCIGTGATWRWLLWNLELFHHTRLRCDGKTYQLAMDSASSQRWKVVHMLMETMAISNLQLNKFHYTSLVKACQSSLHWPSALLFPPSDVDARAVDATWTSATLTATCAGGGPWRWARAWFDSVGHKCVEPNVMSYGAALRACEKGPWGQTLLLMRQQMDAHVSPTVISLGAALGAGKFNWDMAYELLTLLTIYELKGNTVIYNSAILAGRQSWKHARGLLKEMLVRQLRPDPVTQSSISTVEAKQGRWRSATWGLRVWNPIQVGAALSSFQTSSWVQVEKPDGWSESGCILKDVQDLALGGRRLPGRPL